MAPRWLVWLLRRNGHNNAKVKIVRVKSWMPHRDQLGIAWPVILRDSSGTRETCQPIWDWPSIRAAFTGERQAGDDCRTCGGLGHSAPFEVRDEVNTFSRYMAVETCPDCHGTGKSPSEKETSDGEVS